MHGKQYLPPLSPPAPLTNACEFVGYDYLDGTVPNPWPAATAAKWLRHNAL